MSVIGSVRPGRKPTFYCDDVGDDASGFAIACSNVGAAMYGECQALNFSFRLMTEVWLLRMALYLKVRRARGWIKTSRPQTSNSETIRVVITQPASEMPENGYPVVFYGHGVEQQRTELPSRHRACG